jgi:hypothetical protein
MIDSPFEQCALRVARYMLTAPVGAGDGCTLGFGDSAAAGAAGELADADAAAAGATGVMVGIGVGTDTVGTGPAVLGADDGLAASPATGCDAISAVPAPYSYTNTPPLWPV